ncbi:sigma-54-dependent transcriptional regulator [Sphingobium lignivorans]|uniref:DNA-binding NtrC family response regulator n=1 Tax=Sphingobium lignivorans TaxID=2735886 RepID=A0ABR6NJR6_9SPHN|nr:sigma-54 dependent transcriptional regulator [Sphingobium lignivorans]MBB5986723.1 DNA-binding NtrC family response regulator [Sphingobium lignivorans]
MERSHEFDLCIVVDDDEDILMAARMLLRGLFAEVVTVRTPQEAMPLLARKPEVVLLDANFARGATDAAEGLAWLDRMLLADPDLVVVMITAHAGVQIAVAAMKRGATDFVSKPWANERLLATVRTAAMLRRSRSAVSTERGKVATVASSGTGETPLLGDAPAMARVHSLIARAGPTDANVLILGENGTGKELVARALHRASLRAERAMVTVDLGAISEELIDSELFGHLKGAFTDARADRVGRIEAADGGTLFLDEIGNLPLHLQPKLLTALEQRKVTPVGANKPVPVDIRVIAATNMSRDRLTDEGHFRQDLLFRLNTVEIDLPPLRERREDIPLLVAHFLALYARRYDRPPPELSDGARAALMAHDWPGNVRALRHAVERAVILSNGGPLQPDDFPLSASAPRVPVTALTAATPAEAGDLNLDRAEKRMVEEALRKHGYNISLAAAELGLSRAALYRRMEKHGL